MEKKYIVCPTEEERNVLKTVVKKLRGSLEKKSRWRARGQGDCPASERASRRVCMTSKEIIDIAADCGLDNLGYFYRLFKKRYALSPRRYRLANHAVIASK